MTGRKISFYILAAFIAGTLLLTYIQYNSAKNINILIKDNEKLLAEFKVRRELKEVERDIFFVESKTRGSFITGDAKQLQELKKEIEDVERDIAQLKKISNDDTADKYINELAALVLRKADFSKHLLNSLPHADRGPAGNIIDIQNENAITDSITTLIQIIDSTRQKRLENVILSTDKSGKKAQQLSNVLTILVLLSGAGLFWYIINIILKQTSLIRQLNISRTKEKESAQVKENFMANISHEIRTPMNAILGFTNLLQRKSLDPDSEEYVQIIRKSGENLLNLINDMLDLSKIEAGMMKIDSNPFNIRSLIHYIETMLKPKATEKKLALSVKVDASVPEILEGDAIRLSQILVNLVGNALKFTDKGYVSLSLTNEGLSKNKIDIGITVNDTGIGIKKEELTYIFDRFQQAEDSITRRYGGTGLGLSIVRDLVLLQNGTIAIRSEPGKGSSFILKIPYKIASGNKNKLPSENVNYTSPAGVRNASILIVEDNEINQTLLKHLFKEWQLNYTLAWNGLDAIDKLKKEKYDLILMDIRMPEMDGYTATEEIRNKLKVDTPIIAMTAHALSGEREKCLSHGMNEYISKPIPEQQLHKLISHFISLKTLQDPHKPADMLTPAEDYKHIDLRYMQEVSGGNIEYEKNVTDQFIETIQENLQSLENAWRDKQPHDIQYLAHNMKTTVSVMGLHEKLQSHLDILEYEQLDQEIFYKNFYYIKFICDASLEEAKKFRSTLQ